MSKKSDYIIAIGSSAGGLSPLKAFFDFAPSDQVSYVLLSHLSMDHKSELKVILKPHSKLKIQEADDEMLVETNIIYLLPSSKMMIIENGKLLLMNRPHPPIYPNRAVDIFLESLATDKKDKAVAVILSGSGIDGMRGAEAIKKAGGMVIAQEPSSCEHDSMPSSVIRNGSSDYILLPEEMPQLIQHYINSKIESEKV